MSSIDQDKLQAILDANSKELSLNQIKNILKSMHSSEIAHALESSPPEQRKLLFSLIETSDEEMFSLNWVKKFSKTFFQKYQMTSFQRQLKSLSWMKW
jgi:Mg/Co/Ni transporter MgtE